MELHFQQRLHLIQAALNTWSKDWELLLCVSLLFPFCPLSEQEQSHHAQSLLPPLAIFEQPLPWLETCAYVLQARQQFLRVSHLEADLPIALRCPKLLRHPVPSFLDDFLGPCLHVLPCCFGEGVHFGESSSHRLAHFASVQMHDLEDVLGWQEGQIAHEGGLLAHSQGIGGRKSEADRDRGLVETGC